MWKAIVARMRGRRFTDRFSSAVDRLADPQAPLRVGAMRTLETLAQDHPRGRQAVVDVLCAYLRMPVGGDEPVRRTAMTILANHLRPGGPSFWNNIRLDLTGATLVDLDLSSCQIEGGLVLDSATLVGQARLRGLVVGGPASLRGATFKDNAWFERAYFAGVCRFDHARFEGDAWFGATTFAARTSFDSVEFGGHAWFGGTQTRGPIDFRQAVFRRSAGFRGASVEAGAELDGTTFVGPARVSRRGDGWSLTAPGWTVIVDPDNEAVGQLLWVGGATLVETK